MAQQQSKYAPIWEKLKTERKVSVAVPRPLHKRIIKAVIKRKDEDVAHKYLLGERGIKAKLHYDIQDSIIHFTLKYFINGIGEL